MTSRQDLGTLRLRWSGRTDRGRVRENNEDAFLGLRFDAYEVHHLGAIGEATTGHHDFAFAVSDGMGGAKAGEHASGIAVQKLMTLLPRSYHQSAMGLESGFSDVMEELFEQIHRALVFLGRSYEECSGMEATLSLCWFTPGWMYFGHVGDSRIYYLPAGTTGLRQLSHDDTHVGWLLRNGKITERAARSHPRRKVLQKALGGGNQFVTPQVGAVGYEKGDRFLLCTDGIVEGLFDEQIAELVRTSTFEGPGVGPADRLIRESCERDGRDNLTALVIEVD
ncbi:MAG: protein phosphatase 2C domain-containing protein [Nitrospira sp.]|nr:protein phosphatase 2C domain-containing protein [Nitrospira sp.]